MKPFTLYKVHENDDCDKFQNVVRYLYYKGFDIRPLQIIERNIPADITHLPTIIHNYNNIEGLNSIVLYYEKLLGMTNVLNNATDFCLKNPNYRINDRSTHKKLL